MKAEIRIPTETNGFILLDLNDVAMTAYNADHDGQLVKLIEIVKALNPDSPLHKNWEPRLLRLRFDRAVAECTIKDTTKEIEQLEAKQQEDAREAAPLIDEAIQNTEIPSPLLKNVGVNND